ncbi:MAG TPA: D-alanyl-lipoteichoic acid biosynthesis protein DltD, partial [Clostridium sp.]|nr:D-alanyl-lipoteichoic acid biosynthesis protein DltD [Clostridium sp.]
EKMANDYGFKALNYSDKEYEKYFMSDGMHLGWRGWLKINNDIKEYFTKI